MIEVSLKDNPKENRLNEVVKKRYEEGVDETLVDAFERIRSMKNTQEQQRLIEVAYEAMMNEREGRLKTGKIHREEILMIGRKVDDEDKIAKQQERIEETIENKPHNYFVITDNNELSNMVQRLREEVKLQQEDEWFLQTFKLFNDTHIRRKLSDNDVEIPEIKSLTVWDTETSGTDTMIDLTGGYSVWLPLLNEGYYVAYGHLTQDDQCTRSKALKAIKKFMEHPEHAKSYHNASFDFSMFLNDGMIPKGFRYDSMDAQTILNEHEESVGLKQLFTKYKKHLKGDHLDDFTFEDLFGKGSPMVFSPEPVGIYAIKDVEKGWLLTKWQIDMLTKVDDLYKPYFEIRQFLCEVNTTIERTGFVVNTERLAELEREYTEKLEEAKRSLYEAYDIDDEFIRKMDRTINHKKVNDWIEKQQRRIDRKKNQIVKKEEKVKDFEQRDKIHLKSYKQDKEALDRYRRELEELNPPIEEYCPVFTEEFNLDSTSHIGYLIYDILKIEDKTKMFDKSKERSTSKDVLNIYFKEEESLTPLADYSKLSTLLGTFIRKIPNALDYDGRIHTKLKSVSTGRYGSSGYSGKPVDLYRDNLPDEEYLEHMKLLVETEKNVSKGTNLQNIPARSEEGLKVRMTFEPPEGHTFVGSDLSSIEPRIQAHRMSTEFGDDKFADMYRKGLDPYVEFASILFDVPKEKCTEDYYKSVKGTDDEVPAYRKAMKQMFLAIGYGQAFDMFYKGVIPFGIEELHALAAYEKFDEILPGYKNMVAETYKHLRKHGWTKTIFGQKRRFPDYVKQYKRLSVLMNKAGIDDKNDEELGKKSYKLSKSEKTEFWDLMRKTGRAERSAFNHTIQGSGANILQLCMIRLYFECVETRGWEFSLTLHDEVKTAIPNEQLTEGVIDLYDDIMTNTYSLVTPLACDTVVEPVWMEEYSREEWFNS